MLKRTHNCKTSLALIFLNFFFFLSSCVTIQVNNKDNSIRRQGIHATAVHHPRWRHKPAAEATPNRNGNKILCEHRTRVSAGNWFFLSFRVGVYLKKKKFTMPVTGIFLSGEKKKKRTEKRRL